MYEASSSFNRDHFHQNVSVYILEQPAERLRFRYKKEAAYGGHIHGVNSNSEIKTFPSIQVYGYNGKAQVVVSCVTKDAPFRPHPHKIVGKKGCKNGVCILDIPQDTMSITFSNLGIQCVKIEEIVGSLDIRKEINVDPFQTGFEHRFLPKGHIDLKALRLCFEIFVPDNKGLFRYCIVKTISNPIFQDQDLVIYKLSDCSSTADGGKEMIILCEKIQRNDIEIRFFEEKNGKLIWEEIANFLPANTFRQTAVWFKIPPYKDCDINEPVEVFIQLRRPSDGKLSDPYRFEYIPIRPAPYDIDRKRKHLSSRDSIDEILRKCQPRISSDQELSNHNQLHVDSYPMHSAQATDPLLYGVWVNPLQQDISTINPLNNNFNAPTPNKYINVLTNITPNIPFTCNTNNLNTEVMNVENPDLNILLNMDSQNLQVLDVNSDDISIYDAFNTDGLCKSLTNSLSI